MNETVRQLAVDVTNHIANRESSFTGDMARMAKEQGRFVEFLKTMYDQANPYNEEDVEIAEKVMRKVLGDYYEVVKNLTLTDFE